MRDLSEHPSEWSSTCSFFLRRSSDREVGHFFFRGGLRQPPSVVHCAPGSCVAVPPSPSLEVVREQWTGGVTAAMSCSCRRVRCPKTPLGGRRRGLCFAHGYQDATNRSHESHLTRIVNRVIATALCLICSGLQTSDLTLFAQCSESIEIFNSLPIVDVMGGS